MQLPVLTPSHRPSKQFDDFLSRTGASALTRVAATTLQINVGRRCNQACLHCHVEAGPKRTETMSDAIIERIFWLVDRSPTIRTLDITGGAPELHPRFREIVVTARARGLAVIDRCNLTILEEPGMHALGEFLAANEVEIIASLPCYSQRNVDEQRGAGVFEASIRGLRRLNALGYGMPARGLSLSLVYNPGGAFLPPAQATLEAKYKVELRREFGVEFDRLLTITNMPIKRFDHSLRRDGALEAYEALLLASFNPETIPGLMCRGLVSVSWDGKLYDCDFNQMLELPSPIAGKSAPSVFDIDSLSRMVGERVATGSHCFGCTAGAGSSCGGALAP